MVADIRWVQRFANFDKALLLLRSALREHVERVGRVLYERPPHAAPVLPRG